MSEESTESTSVVTEAITGSEPKLFAGKYKTVEELEEGYKASLKVHLENKELKEKYDEATAVPEHYSIPEGIGLREVELSEISQIAQSSGLTQAQFERTARAMEGRIKSQRESFDKARKEIGDERLVLIEDYVKKTYPESLQQPVLNHIIKDKQAMDDALKHRDKLLDSRVPGMEGAGNQGKKQTYDGQKDVMEAAREFERNPTQANKDRYIALAAEVGNERFKDKIRDK